MSLANNKRLSFEFFPTKTAKGLENLTAVCQQLKQFKPAFFSVTYGAGGSTRNNTLDVVQHLLQQGVDVAPHLSFGNDDDNTILELLSTYQQAGVKRIVALRGDTPSGSGITEPVYAQQLVSFIRNHTQQSFELEVAAYPEIHPQAESYDSDIRYLKRKLEAGAQSAITQYFFNPDAYFYFLERCHQEGIQQPIYPGIMPIINFANLQRFSASCGADIPRWISQRIEAYNDDQASIQAFGYEVVSKMCRTLLEGGAPGLHFYTMNQHTASASIIERL